MIAKPSIALMSCFTAVILTTDTCLAHDHAAVWPAGTYHT